MAQWEGEEGVKHFFSSFFTLKNDAFVLPRERKSKDEEGGGKKNAHFWTSFEKKKKSKFFGEVELCG